MLRQVIVRSVRYAPQLTPAEGEQELDIRGCLGVEGKFFRIMVADTHLLLFHSQTLQEINTVLFPVRKPFQIRIRLTEELHLHLFELSHTEDKVAGCDLVSERFTHLADAKRNLLAGGSLHILEINKNTLCRLRTQIYGVLRVLCDALEGLEHQIELSDIRKVMFAASRTGNVMFLDKIFHLLLAPAVHGTVKRHALLCNIVFYDLIRTESFMTFLTIHQRIGEAAQMSAGNPCLRIH